MKKKIPLIAIVFCVVFCLTISAANAADLSRSWQPWPKKVSRPAMPASAQKFLAPAGTVSWVASASKGIINGSNSRPMWVWATKSCSSGSTTWKYWRVGQCGNPCGGYDIKNIPQAYCPPPTPAPPQTPCQAQEVCVNVDERQCNAPLNYYQQAPLEASQRFGYKIESTREVMGAYVYKLPTCKAATSPETCPPGGPVPTPPPANGCQFPHYGN